MALERHPLSERFHELLMLCGELHDRKQADYGREDDPFANVRASIDFGVPGWIGAMIRGNDKMRRIQKVARQVIAGEPIHLENESMENSLFDLAVYSLISYVLFEDDQKANEQLEEIVGRSDDVVFEMPQVWGDRTNEWLGEIHAAIREWEREKGIGRVIDLIVLNRHDMDVDALYSIGGPPTTLWGIPVAVSDQLPKNTFELRRRIDHGGAVLYETECVVIGLEDEGLDPIETAAPQ